MGKKNWIEFDSQENIYKEKPKEENIQKILKKKSRLFILKQV